MKLKNSHFGSKLSWNLEVYHFQVLVMVRSVMTKSRKMTFGSKGLDEKATLKDRAAGRKQVSTPLIQKTSPLECLKLFFIAEPVLPPAVYQPLWDHHKCLYNVFIQYSPTPATIDRPVMSPFLMHGYSFPFSDADVTERP